MFENKKCYGVDYRLYNVDTIHSLDIAVWINAYKQYGGKQPFFNSFFMKLAGTPTLQRQLEEKKTSDEIRATWKNDIDAFKLVRQKYLLYHDF